MKDPASRCPGIVPSAKHQMTRSIFNNKIVEGGIIRSKLEEDRKKRETGPSAYQYEKKIKPIAQSPPRHDYPPKQATHRSTQ